MNHLAEPASPVGDETKLAALRRDFSIPARRPLSPVQADVLRRARPFTQPHEEGDLACWRYGDQEPLIVLVHGWSGRGTDLLPFVPPLRAAGFSVVLFDLPAHRDSSGSVASPVHAGRALLT
jgi:pimeloyl-ACP methyl ester carboxylesterase